MFIKIDAEKICKSLFKKVLVQSRFSDVTSNAKIIRKQDVLNFIKIDAEKICKSLFKKILVQSRFSDVTSNAKIIGGQDVL